MYQSQHHLKQILSMAALALAIGVVLGIYLMPNDPNLELAAAARHAIESADRARRESDAAHLAPARWRLLAIAIGTTAPLAVATIALAIVTRSRPDALDVLLAMAESHTSLPPRRTAPEGSSRRRLFAIKRIVSRTR